MRILITSLVCVALSATVLSAQENVRQKPATANKLECGEAVAFQVMLDRHGFSPGEIDGTIGPNAARALAAFQSANSLNPSGAADCPTWDALAGEGTGVTTAYSVTEQDADGPFAPDIPDDLVQQANLPALAYRSLIERIGERFHVSPRLLTRLNPGVTIAPGASIQVPAVMPFDEKAKPASEGQAKAGREGDLRVEVSREGSLRVLRA